MPFRFMAVGLAFPEHEDATPQPQGYKPPHATPQPQGYKSPHVPGEEYFNR